MKQHGDLSEHSAKTGKWTLSQRVMWWKWWRDGAQCKAPITSCVFAVRLFFLFLLYFRFLYSTYVVGTQKGGYSFFFFFFFPHRLQLHPLKENDVPLEVGVCLAGREMADLGRVIDWKSGVCHSTLVLRGVIHSRLLWVASAAGEK